MNDRPIPIDTDAEMAVLGCIMAGVELDDLRPILRTPEAFSVPDHRTVYQALCDLAEDAEPEQTEFQRAVAGARKGEYT